MAKNKPDTPVAAKVIPPAAPVKVAPLEERMATHKESLLAMQKQLTAQLNGVANQLFLIDQLENPGVEMDPTTGEPAETPETLSNDTPDGHM